MVAAKMADLNAGGDRRSDDFKAPIGALKTQRQAADLLKLMAERKAGEILAGMVKNKGTAIKTRSHDVTTLQDMGISKAQSSRWQRAANPESNRQPGIVSQHLGHRHLFTGTSSAPLHRHRSPRTPITGTSSAPRTAITGMDIEVDAITGMGMEIE
jgi:hypothetical protein